MSRNIPDPPRVISPTPTPTDDTAGDYFSDTPASSRRRSSRLKSQSRTRDTPSPADSPAPESRARSKTREESLRKRRMSGRRASQQQTHKNLDINPPPQAQNGSLLSPANIYRSLSRSPSPLGLIPIHQSWRSFIHRHEIPRKALHVSIGFVTLALYARGAQPGAIHPALLAALLPIAAVDVLRRRIPALNAAYVRVLGALMRESEVQDRSNGVIWYLLGAWAVLRLAPKDVAVVAVVLLSWCDTAASTVGRAFGRYTPQVRRGKSLAGTLAAALVGAASAALFWGVVAPAFEAPAGPAVNDGVHAFAFQRRLHVTLPALGAGGARTTFEIAGASALTTMSLVAGAVASASEAVDLFGLDDNVSIPVLCGIGLWGFLWLFGDARAPALAWPV